MHQLVYSIFVGCLAMLTVIMPAHAQSRDIPLIESSMKTFYLQAAIGEFDAGRFMVDTGSGYTTINKTSFEALQKTNKLQFVKKILGVLADGSQREVDIWQIESLTINGVCTLKNIQVAYMPHTERQILGLTALRKAAPFTLSVNPPAITLSNCG